MELAPVLPGQAGTPLGQRATCVRHVFTPIILSLMLGNMVIERSSTSRSDLALHDLDARDLLLVPLDSLPRALLPQVIALRFLAAYTGNTLAAYRRDLAHYFAWCESNEVDALGAGRSTIDLYVRDLSVGVGPDGGVARPLARTTVARRLTSINGFYAYAVDEEVLDRNPARRVRRPRQPEDSPTLGLDRHEARRLLDAAAAHSPRAEALVSLLLHCGLRISEALQADVADLGHSHGHRVLAIVRKGGARRNVALPAPVSRSVDLYIAGRGRPNGPLFDTRTGGRFDRAEAWRLIRRLAADAGIEGQRSPHSCRHSFVTLSRQAGVPLEDVQDAAGHADARTTRKYDRARHGLDRSPAHTLGVYLASTTPAP